jgi:subtilase family protein
VVVVAAAGNWGKHSDGTPVWGGIAAPGNAPWVITVGASSTNGTPSRGDDTMATFSSRGPTYLDWGAKPDLVAPGTGTVSLAAPGSTFFNTRASALLPGADGTLEYLSLSGTSMAAPVVSGVVAQMLQVNPTLTPNAVKAILEYTAEQYPAYKPLEQGAGFLNAVGAVRLARFYATAQPGQAIPIQKMWSQHIIWGSHRLGGGLIDPRSNAYAIGTNWGVAKTDTGDNIVWGTNVLDNLAWGTSGPLDNIVWGTDGGDNIVWGTDCGGADCDNVIWGTADPLDNIIWGTADPGDNIVWGTAGLNADNIVWGTDALDNIIWGTDALDNIIWGTDALDNIVWGTDDGDNIVWGTADGDNIVWGTDDGDNIVWGTDALDNIIWGTDDGDNIIWGANANIAQVWEESPDLTKVLLSGAQTFDKLSDRKLLRLIQSRVTHVSVPPPPASAPVATTTTADTTTTTTTSTTPTTTTTDTTSTTTTAPTTTTTTVGGI